MPAPTVLLLASHHSLADRMTTLLRDGGFEVVPGWFSDARHQSLDGTPVDIVLVDLRHHAARSPAFTRMAAQLGVALAYFDASDSPEPDIITQLGGADSAAPVVSVTDQGARLLETLRTMVPPRRGDGPTG